MWYNEEQKSVAKIEVYLPTGQLLRYDYSETAEGWEWHDAPPQWWVDMNPPRPDQSEIENP